MSDDGWPAAGLELGWAAVDGRIDLDSWAQLLSRAHRLALARGEPPPIVRELVAESWRRALQRGVEPEHPVPRRFDDARTAALLAAHPIAPLLPRIVPMLRAATSHAGQIAALSDADGVLLWTDGPSQACERAAAVGFAPGHDCGEAAIGTNAIGTALELEHPVQIFSAEHFNRRLHSWTCVAAPLYDPETRELLGALDLSGSFKAAHPHSLALVSLAASAVESHLAARIRRRNERLTAAYLDEVPPPSRRHTAVVTAAGRVVLSFPPGWLGCERIDIPPPGVLAALPGGQEIVVEPLGEGHLVRLARGPAAREPRRALYLETLGHRRAWVSESGARVEAHRRHAEILTLLLLHPDGLAAEQVARELYGDARRTVTVRAEVSRLRKVLGAVIEGNPYRLLSGVRADFRDVEECLARGDVAEAVRLYRGPLLAWSQAPAIVAARRRLDLLVRTALEQTDDAEALCAWIESPAGEHDAQAHRRLLERLPDSDPRRSRVVAASRALGHATSVQPAPGR